MNADGGYTETFLAKSDNKEFRLFVSRQKNVFTSQQLVGVSDDGDILVISEPYKKEDQCPISTSGVPPSRDPSAH